MQAESLDSTKEADPMSALQASPSEQAASGGPQEARGKKRAAPAGAKPNETEKKMKSSDLATSET